MGGNQVRKRLFVMVLTCGLGGCAGMVDTPEHARPETAAMPEWSADLPAEYGIDPSWWEGFGDPTLNGLVRQAISGNLDLKVLAARSDQSRAQIGQAEALRLPVLNAGTRTDTTDVTGFSTSNKYGTGAELIWELDIWGKARKGIEAEAAGYQASRADWRAGYLVIVGGVVDGYFRVRLIDAQRAQQGRALAQGEQVLDIYRRLHEQGLAPRTQVARQEAEVHGLQVGLKDLNRARALAQNALATLVGAPPGEVHIDDTSDREAVAIPTVPAGLPADLLSRRPDLLAAEYRLLQAVELEGQARLGRLPTVGLTGLGGSASFGLSSLLSSWTAGLSSVVQFPVFDPNVRARIRVSESQVALAEASYRVAVMRAFEEVETILINLDSWRSQRGDLEARRDKLVEVDRLTRRQLEMGLVSQLDVLEQERSMLAAEQALIANEWQIATDTVELFKATGGGWPEERPGTEV